MLFRSNLALSQARAEAVMVALQGRQVDVSAMRAIGYGEGVPVGDNGDESGREANRRIEFTLMNNGPVAAGSQQTVSAGEPGSRAVTQQAPASEASATEAPAAGTAAPGGPSLAPQEKTARPKTRPKA